MHALFFAAALATTNTAAELPPIVVEASRLDQTKGEAAAHVDVFSRAHVDSSGAQNAVEFLERRANLFVRRQNANPAQAQIALRGYGANSFARVKIVVDGEKLDNPDMAPQDLMRIPLHAVRKIEILHGPQTVLHGGDASAGVIHVVSESEDYARKTAFEVHGGNLGRVGVNAGTRGGFADEALSYYADSGYEHSDGWRKNSGYDQWSARGGVKQRFDNGSWWKLKAFYSNSRYGLPGGLYTGGAYGNWKDRAREADDPDSQARNAVYGFNFSGKGVFDDENAATAEFSFRERQSESYSYLDYGVHTLDGALKYENTAARAGFENRFDVGADLKQDFLDVHAYDAKSRYGGDNDYTRFSGALFARDEFWPCDALSVFAGVRGEGFCARDRYDLHPAAGTANSSKGAVAGEAGVNWRPNDDLKVFARWTRFYHAPLADEMFSSYGIPNMALDPETGHNAELGVDWTFLENANFNFTAYHAEVEDEIAYLNQANRNVPDDTARTGFETSLTWTKEKVGSAGILYGYVHSRFVEGVYAGCDVPLVPRQRLRLYGEWFLCEELALGGGLRFVGRQRYGGDFANAGGHLPDYALFDFGARAMPSWAWLKGFTLAFSVDNLFDRRYCDYGEYFGAHYVYPACGRCLSFSLRYEF